jgi:O6-methylguanine-DNA--protein-cysteine methyltransferase
VVNSNGGLGGFSGGIGMKRRLLHLEAQTTTGNIP